MTRTFLIAAAAIAALTGSAVAGDLANLPDGPLRGGLTTEFGTRAWLGWGITAKDLYDPGDGSPLSRLTYGGMSTASAELFGKVTGDAFFLSGYAALGTLPSGTLQDEDFAPATSPYSSTQSQQQDGSLHYLTVDLGHYFYDSGRTRIGGFVGYNYLNQQVNAFGCTQEASNPSICVPPISGTIEGISQENTWQSLRLGINGDVAFGEHWSLSGEGALLPYVSMSGADTHRLRIPSDFTGPIPEDGTGWGVQLQAMLDYHLNDHLSVGFGGRYWRMQATGAAHFEDHVSTGVAEPQPLTTRTSLFGALAEVKASF